MNAQLPAPSFSLLDDVQTAIAVLDSAARVVFANRALRAMAELPTDAALPELFGLAADPAVLSALRNAVASNDEFTGELPAQRAGQWWRVRCAPARTVGDVRILSLEDASEPRRLRESLRASEARLELAMDASELAMWDWNVEHDEVYYNDQWWPVLGIAPEALLQRTELANRLLLPEDQADVLEQFERHYRGETPRFDSEYRLMTGSGALRWFVARAKVVRRGTEGQALRVIGVLRDVTSRRSTQQEAEESQRRWERAVRGTSDGLYDWDLSTGHVWYAARFREILNFDVEEFPDTFTAFQNAVHMEDRQHVLEGIRGHLEGRGELDVRCRLHRGGGDLIWCRLRGQAERDAAGRPRRLAGSISDISAQVTAEEALRRSQDFYGTILDSLPLFIAYADCDERLVFANDPFKEVFAVTAEPTRGQPAAAILGAKRYAAIGPYVRRALAGETIDLQGRLRNAGGKNLEIDATFVPHRDEGGTSVGCFVVARDVTERRLLEAELRQSQKMEAVGRLTGGIAHDFNNLLSVVVGNMQLLARSLQESPRLLKHAETALRAAVRGGELTRRLLAFARQQVLEPRVLAVNESLLGMYELLRRALTDEIEIRQVLEPQLWPIKADPGQLENAVLNLVINARDAMPSGGVITVTTRNLLITAGSTAEQNLLPGAYTVLEVTDTGAGMSPAVLKRAFEPFFTTKDVGKGSGLGLSMVYGFLKQSGGHVAITSAADAGTTVHLYFPRVLAEPWRGQSESRPPLEPGTGTETILVVEDDMEVRQTAIELLASLGYHTLEAATGPQALQQFMQHPEIALVFTDVMLPGGLLGTQLVQKLRERRPDLKILLTSGYTGETSPYSAMAELKHDLLAKPYQLEDLARRVRAALDDLKEEQRVRA
jgi:PAS domain S-box-containing protein